MPAVHSTASAGTQSSMDEASTWRADPIESQDHGRDPEQAGAAHVADGRCAHVRRGATQVEGRDGRVIGGVEVGRLEPMRGRDAAAGARGERALDPLRVTSGEDRVPEEIAGLQEHEWHQERDDQHGTAERLPQRGHQQREGHDGVHAHVHEEQVWSSRRACRACGAAAGPAARPSAAPRSGSVRLPMAGGCHTAQVPSGRMVMAYRSSHDRHRSSSPRWPRAATLARRTSTRTPSCSWGAGSRRRPPRARESRMP